MALVSAIGDTVRAASELREPDDCVSRDPTSEDVASLELSLRGSMGRRLVAFEATNRFQPPGTFFLAGDCTVRLSVPVAVVLVEDWSSMSSSSSTADSCGDRNLAVGRGPDAEGPLAFFRIGWEGGGFDALDERLRSPFSLGIIFCLCEGIEIGPCSITLSSVDAACLRGAGAGGADYSIGSANVARA